MISQNEIRQKAREYGVPLSTVERDYVQGWLLVAISPLPLVLKGGTGIRKAYISDYRFSDDLDFTLLQEFDEKELRKAIENVIEKTKEDSGINFLEDFTFSENDNGFEIEVYFQLMQRGSNRTRIKLDITKTINERTLLPVVKKKIIHLYSDSMDCEIQVYSLEEIMAEKIRSLFQRTRPRDLYDVWYLWNNVNDIDREKIFKILPEKLRTKRTLIDAQDLENRKDDFKNAWKNSLEHQLKELPDFEEVFSSVLKEVRRMCVEMIKNNKEAILIGEIGAMLHDIGKLHPNFIKLQSVESIRGLPHHAREIDKFMKQELIDLFKRIKIDVGGESELIYNFIKDHHNPNGRILKYLEQCDKKDSADDKGIVRRKQPLDDTWISSPFGYQKKKIDLDCLQKSFDCLEDNLIGFLKNYLSKNMCIECLRSTLINTLKAVFSHALGETRVPANDVTLWDHSYSTASLFKTVLAGVVCSAYQSGEPKWRIFGVCWNGVEFINKGKKVAEIQSRSDVIDDLKEALKKKFEEEIPIGNTVYEDTDGIYFTFPDLERAIELAKECVKISLKEVYEKSQNELWPFFILSKPTKTLTIITEILQFVTKKIKIPRMTPVLFVDGEEITFENPEISPISERQDVCPICGIRSKDEKKERCTVCDNRRRGRLSKWLLNREDTIWIDEVADKNNRIALISLNFDLDKWLDGTMIGTVYSQTFKDWLDSKSGKLKDPEKVKEKIIENEKETECWNQIIAKLNFPLFPSKETVFKVLDKFFDKNTDKKTRAEILSTFFEENIKLNESTLEKHLDNIKERIGTDQLTRENLATFLFTQNPSPARLHRTWCETEEFLNLVVKKAKERIYSTKWKRVKFQVNGLPLNPETPYIIQIDSLNPQKLLVFHIENGEFYTIESLEKYKFNNKVGETAIREALSSEFEYLASEDNPQENLLTSIGKVKPDKPTVEEYYPLIVINKSAHSLRLIVPAYDSMKVINLIMELYNERFSKVTGKLPLNIKLLVTKRKFPLYILLDAEKRMLEGEEFKKQIPMNPWWNINRYDEFYGFYPVKSIEQEKKYTLDDLDPISKGKIFYLYPGYFDFELLFGTIDRYKLVYSAEKSKVSRADEDYRLFTARPCYLHQISEILDLWDVLTNLTSSQIHFIEEILSSKLQEWRNVKNSENVFMKFAEAVLKDAFGDKWSKLRDETKCFLVRSTCNGFLLDSINLFGRVLCSDI